MLYKFIYFSIENIVTDVKIFPLVRDNEAAMIEKIATNVSAELLNYAPSSVLDSYVGMRDHMVKMEQLLCLL